MNTVSPSSGTLERTKARVQKPETRSRSMKLWKIKERKICVGNVFFYSILNDVFSFPGVKHHDFFPQKYPPPTSGWPFVVCPQKGVGGQNFGGGRKRKANTASWFTYVSRKYERHFSIPHRTAVAGGDILCEGIWRWGNTTITTGEEGPSKRYEFRKKTMPSH